MAAGIVLFFLCAAYKTKISFNAMSL